MNCAWFRLVARTGTLAVCVMGASGCVGERVSGSPDVVGGDTYVHDASQPKDASTHDVEREDSGEPVDVPAHVDVDRADDTAMGDTGVGDTGVGDTGMGDTPVDTAMGDTGVGDTSVDTAMGDTGEGDTTATPDGAGHCTQDSACGAGSVCDESTGACVLGECVTAADCPSADPCKVGSCLETQGRRACVLQDLPDNTSCDDADACTLVDRCQAGACVGSGSPCDDGLTCTVDVCSQGSCAHTLELGSCLIDETCYADGTANPANSCEECDAGGSPQAWAADDTNSCSDQVACTIDTCVAGACTGTPSDARCNQGGECTAGTCDRAQGCQYATQESGEACGSGGFCWSGGSCVQFTLVGEFGAETPNTLAFSPDGTMLAVASSQSLSVWSLPGLTQTTLSTGNWEGLAWSPDSTWVASSKDPYTACWDCAGALQLVSVASPGTVTPLGFDAFPIQFVADGRFLAAKTMGYDVANARLLDPWRANGAVVALGSAMGTTVVAPAGSYVALSSYDMGGAWMNVHDLATHTYTLSLSDAIPYGFLPDSKRLMYDVFVSTQYTTIIEDLASGAQAVYQPTSGGNAITARPSAISQSGDFFLSAGSQVYVMHPTTGVSVLADAFTPATNRWLKQENVLLSPTGVTSVSSTAESATASFRLYTHDALAQTWGCQDNTTCSAGQYCNLFVHQCLLSPCADGVDNDGDGRTDAVDPDCGMGQLEIVVN